MARKSLVFLGFLGLLFLSSGVFFLFKNQTPDDQIEIISSDSVSKEEKGEIFADIEGAVEKPGVYSLPSGSRLEDLLILSGGFSAEADREWVEKTLNRAQKLTDGMKVYVPSKEETVKGVTSITTTSSSEKTNQEAVSNLVNINTASQKELEALWGIGPVTTAEVIKNRPYSQVSDLKSKKILKSNVYERIESQLTIY